MTQIDDRGPAAGSGGTLFSLLDRVAAEAPERLALAAPGRAPLTYAGLRRHVLETAGALHALGIRRGDRVALVLPDGPEMAAAFLAVAAGATCAPLNPRYRAREFEFYLSDVGARALIVPTGTDSPATSAARSLGIHVVELAPSLDMEAGRF